MNPSVQHNDARFLELLQRWHSGDFTRADEQELNALAASDEFRREAMEGFMSIPEAAHDERLSALRNRLRDRTGRKSGGRRLIALPQIWTAAAVLVLLLAAIWFVPQWNKKDAAPVAQTQVESPEQNAASEPTPATELSENQDIAGKSPAAKSAPSPSGPPQPVAGSQALSSPGAAVAPGDIAAAEESEAVADDVRPDYAAAPAAGRTQPRDEALDKAASEAKKEYAAASREQENAKAKKSRALNRLADSTWHETDRKPDMAAEKKAVRNEMQQPKESEPEGGWEAFGEYLRQNARLTAEARNRNVSGTVLLEFNINTNGEPQGFTVVRSVGYGCDQEAIRLVKNWEWVRGRNPIVTVEVPFVR